MAVDYQGITAVVGDMIGWCEGIVRAPAADLRRSITTDPIPVGPIPCGGTGRVVGVAAATVQAFKNPRHESLTGLVRTC